ncbi:hypothetical protein N800_08790 [Lysobacter daejeonensis GH1-9]|uniref:CopL family metal-binding regulatory protein n=1 Tax=Lysobacter daejeonensis GH1-9 TaxID=1385517 RepID=A0A0A0F143_9GAMM|nr:hypothetical protein N800_08790 [Lysobacter daejeonensis GH1-9]
MAWSALALRCLLIVAFCLDGGASLWKASQMAAHMASKSSNATASTVSDPVSGTAATSAQGCESPGLAVSTSTNEQHEDCDCEEANGCRCPCAFAVKLLVQRVPFAAQHRLAVQPAIAQEPSTAQIKTSAVFRPPIA